LRLGRASVSVADGRAAGDAKVAAHGNFWAKQAARQTRGAHAATPTGRTLGLSALVALWLGSGLIGWSEAGKPPLDALYATFTALGFGGDLFEVDNPALQIMRFAGPAVPLAGLIAAFWRRLGHLLALTYLRFARRHVVIVGASQAALHLAQQASLKGSAVVVIAAALEAETVAALARQGVLFLQADPAQPAALRAARAAHAAHVLAFSGEQALNLRVEAALHAIAHTRRARRPAALHLELNAPALLREARDLRQELERARAKREQQARTPRQPPLDVMPFSLAELAAREVMARLTPRILDRCLLEGQDRPHLLLIGFDATAQALAAWVLATLWSSRLQAPRVTVLTPAPAESAAAFRADFPQAQAHEIWQADIAFEAAPQDLGAIDASLLATVEEARGPVTFAAASLPDEGATLLAAIALLRACSGRTGEKLPILTRERACSEFTRQYGLEAEGGSGAAFLAPMGQWEQIATPDLLLDGALDRAAALYHTAYEAQQSANLQKELTLAARGGWLNLAETYRHANRAVADHTIVKLWDCGWRPARRKEKAAAKAIRVPDALLPDLARLEHSRWMAERLLNGWRPGPARDNRARVHPDLRPWDALSPEAQAKDEGMVRMAEQVAGVLYSQGFSPTAAEPAS